MKEMSTSGKIGRWLGYIILLSACRPAEQKELKIPPLPNGEQAVIQTSLAALTDAIEDEPRNGSYYFRRAALYEQAHRYGESLQDINKAIEYRSTNEAYGRYYVLRGRIYLLQNKIDQAYADAVQSEKLGAQSAAAYLLRGQMYAIKGKYTNAMNALKEAKQMTPFDPQVYYWEANASAGLGDTAQAISLFHTTLQTRKDYIQAYNRLTEIYAKQRDFVTAKQYAYAGLKIDSNNVLINNNLGSIYRLSKQTDSAVYCFQRSLKRDTLQHNLNYELGRIFFDKKNYWTATPYFEKLTTQFAKYPDVPELLAVCYDLTGQERGKMESLQAVLAVDSTDKKTILLYEALNRRITYKRRQMVMDSLATKKQQIINIAPVEIRRR
ncbi:tetratricopeptide repeat protein [Cytophagaceae bacterium DM2B3-1]|uniref:Tetratricopeptide repeat protein n=2 Tax=Xanthocytophaga flava TaxID=3048013 RepID=A0ABT7CWM4_9BACT|nr:tetratricopeptide repeat protein [Xanthocytophaga flavus]